MTTITKTCTEMALVQTDLQELHKLARAFHAAKWPDGASPIAGVYRVCESAMGVLAARLTRFAAANDNTMVMGAA